MVVNPKNAKNGDFFVCEICDFKCSKLSNYEKHLSTQKHKTLKIKMSGNPKNAENAKSFTCEKCCKKYKDNSGLWRHKKKCKENPQVDMEKYDLSDKIDNELVNKMVAQNNEILKENAELKSIMLESQEKMMEVIKNGTNNIINNTKNKFNLNIFLNENCKNAMNLTDFVNSLTLKLNDLEKMSQLGYVNGMSNLIANNLNEMEITQRPIHCTDKKRQTIYIRDEDRWKRELDGKPNVKNAIRKITNKNLELLIDLQNNNQKCIEDNTINNKFNDYLSNILCNGDKEDDDIVKLLSKEVLIEKED